MERFASCRSVCCQKQRIAAGLGPANCHAIVSAFNRLFSFSLFLTLWGELEQNRVWGKSSTHRQLMAAMQTSLKTIHSEKEKLEGIGLLKTYIKETEHERLFIYELIPPLRPDEFFQDGMLNVFLYNRVGKARFQQLKEYFSHPSVPEEARDITRSFNEVLHLSSRANGRCPTI